jgi:hypothetical protein
MSDATVLRDRFRHSPPEDVLRAVETALRPRFQHPELHQLFSRIVALWITGAWDDLTDPPPLPSGARQQIEDALERALN